MSLITDMPHRATIKNQSSGADAGGGVSLSYTTVQSDVPCRENITGSSEREMFGQQGMVVTATISFRTANLTATIQRGTEIITNGRIYHVKGITVSQGQGTIESITRATCEQQL